MLIDRDTESRILQLLQAVGSAYSVYLIGRSLGQSVSQALSSALAASKLTVLEQSFLAGKVANLLGPDALRSMSKEQIAHWVYTNNVTLSDAERATLNQLRNETERWLQGRTDDWQQRFRTAIANADKDWRATLMGGRFTDAAARSVARNSALEELIAALNGENESFTSQIDRLLQTEMHSYFQQGQVSGRDAEEYVYKIPRLTACPYCMDLHLEGNGAPKLYKLSDVLGNSNWGLPAYAWDFTIGPVHPHCYCILYFHKDKAAGASETRATARKQQLKKSIEHPTTPGTTTLDLLKGTGDGETPPPHETKLVAAIRELYGDDPPR